MSAQYVKQIDAGKKMAAISRQESYSDQDLSKLIRFYPVIIGFMRAKGDELAARELHRELAQFESLLFYRKNNRKW
jgi:hypothetical protein